MHGTLPAPRDEDSYTFTAILTGLEETGEAGGATHIGCVYIGAIHLKVKIDGTDTKR